MVEEDDFDCDTLPRILQQWRLQRQLGDGDESGFESNPQSNDDQSQSDDDAHCQAAEDVFLTDKAIRFEANPKSLNEEDRKKFNASMEEWASWQCFNAVEVLSRELVEQLPDDAQVVGTRWAHTR